MANGTPPQPFRTDALNPSSLPTASLGHLRPLSSRPIQSSSTQPDVSHEEWNLRIDREVKAVVGGLEDLIDLSDIGTDPSPHGYAVQGLHLKIRTASLIKSTQNLRDLAHELRLMLVLSDEVDTVRRRDNEVEGVREEVRRGREEVAREVVKLLGGRVEPEQRSQAGDGDGEGETEEIIASRGQS